MSQSLRSILDDFERTGDLHMVDRPVDPRYELGTVLSLRRAGPTQLFRQVVGYDMPVVGNVLNTRDKKKWLGVWAPGTGSFRLSSWRLSIKGSHRTSWSRGRCRT